MQHEEIQRLFLNEIANVYGHNPIEDQIMEDKTNFIFDISFGFTYTFDGGVE